MGRINTGFTQFVIPAPDQVEGRLQRQSSNRLKRLDIQVLEDTGWRISGQGGAAHRLSLKPNTLESRLKKLGITRNP